MYNSAQKYLHCVNFRGLLLRCSVSLSPREPFSAIETSAHSYVPPPSNTACP
jgi:hypothetical protein